jgi:arsenate reductase (thioredoxin)
MRVAWPRRPDCGTWADHRLRGGKRDPSLERLIVKGSRSLRSRGGMSNVLFVCVANSGRSVMAERLFRRAAGGRHEARSAGSDPGPAVHPQVLEALAEIGIDASDHQPRRLDQDAVEWADVVVATCDDACPVIPGKRYIDWELPDPKQLPVERVRKLRTEIDQRVRQLVEELDMENVAA